MIERLGFYCQKRVVSMPFEQAIARTREALSVEGFGILSEIDVRATLQKKLQVDFRPYTILGACNPPLAHKALTAEPDIGVLLPCNVVVYEGDDPGESVIAAVDPEVSLGTVGNRELAPLAKEVKQRLGRVLDAVGSNRPTGKSRLTVLVLIPRKFHVIKHWKKLLLAGVLGATLPGSSRAQTSMDPYVTAINAPIEKHSVMLMALPDFQVARFGRNFFTGMLMAEYGLTSRLTVGAMAEGQKVGGLPATYGGLRYNAYFHLFPDDRLLNLTLYGEYEDLNGAALYKMEVAGFGPEDLTEPLALARNTPVRTFEQRVIVYHDWDRLNATFNFIRETALQAPRGSDYGYALGLFFRPSGTSGSMTGMAGMSAPPALSMSRFGYGLEMIGALGDNQRFGFYWNAQQHYLGPVLTYTISPRYSVRVEPAVGLSNVSDPFILRMGMAYMFRPSSSKAAPKAPGHS